MLQALIQHWNRSTPSWEKGRIRIRIPNTAFYTSEWRNERTFLLNFLCTGSHCVVISYDRHAIKIFLIGLLSGWFFFHSPPLYTSMRMRSVCGAGGRRLAGHWWAHAQGTRHHTQVSQTPQSNELKRGSWVSLAPLFVGGVHIGARALLDPNLI